MADIKMGWKRIIQKNFIVMGSSDCFLLLYRQFGFFEELSPSMFWVGHHTFLLTE